MDGIEVVIPLKIITGEAKQIIGPYTKIGAHYYLALGFVAPDEISVRWELHLLTDPDGVIESPEGVATILGYKAIVPARYDWKALRRAAPNYGVKGSLYASPRRMPLLRVASISPVAEPVRSLLVLYGLEGARKLLRDLSGKIRIVEA
ncbi:MAG: hypothetical protein F7C34_00620 [Desulfurococcales archaeon]|nr:hypothetical protein [Desulfurococcales archaeon]